MSRASFGNHDSARLALKAGRLQSANTVATVQLLQDGSVARAQDFDMRVVNT